jgi:hypothetical protein
MFSQTKITTGPIQGGKKGCSQGGAPQQPSHSSREQQRATGNKVIVPKKGNKNKAPADAGASGMPKRGAATQGMQDSIQKLLGENDALKQICESRKLCTRNYCKDAQCHRVHLDEIPCKGQAKDGTCKFRACRFNHSPNLVYADESKDETDDSTAKPQACAESCQQPPQDGGDKKEKEPPLTEGFIHQTIELKNRMTNYSFEWNGFSKSDHDSKNTTPWYLRALQDAIGITYMALPYISVQQVIDFACRVLKLPKIDCGIVANINLQACGTFCLITPHMWTNPILLAVFAGVYYYVMHWWNSLRITKFINLAVVTFKILSFAKNVTRRDRHTWTTIANEPNPDINHHGEEIICDLSKRDDRNQSSRTREVEKEDMDPFLFKMEYQGNSWRHFFGYKDKMTMSHAVLAKTSTFAQHNPTYSDQKAYDSITTLARNVTSVNDSTYQQLADEECDDIRANSVYVSYHLWKKRSERRAYFDVPMDFHTSGC